MHAIAYISSPAARIMHAIVIVFIVRCLEQSVLEKCPLHLVIDYTRFGLQRDQVCSLLAKWYSESLEGAPSHSRQV